MELIDKNAVVARLEEKLESLQKEYNEFVREEYWINARDVAPRIDEIRKIISLISNFGGKEADLVKESEDYKQKYEEALSRARVVNPGTKDYNIVTAIFPELKESEDKRIRKEIIHYLDREITLSNFGGDIATFKRWIAWLEKQGKQEQLYIRFGEIPTDEKSKIYQGEMEIGTENGVSVYPAFKTDKGDIVLGLCLPITKTTLYTQQHLIEYDDRPCYLVKGDYVGKDTDGQLLINNISIVEKIDSYRVKEEKQGNPTEKVEPKFKVGDWIVGNYVHTISKVVNIKHLSDGTYGYDLDNSCGCYFASFEEGYHLWSIKDAEKGDILQANKCTLIFDSLTKDIDGNTVISSWYYCNTKTFYGIRTCKPDLWAIEGVTPATQEQCDFLFAKMEEAGYKWDAKKKELKKIESKSAASLKDDIEWLKSLKNGVQPKQEWSEEDKEMIDAVIGDIQFTQKAHNHEVNQVVYERKIDWLKSLKQRLNGTE